MILDSEVLIGLNPQNINYWSNLGYYIAKHIDCKGREKSFRRGAKLKVKVEHLPRESNVPIKVRCSVCSKDRTIPFNQYSNICWKCNLSARTGVQHHKWLHRVKTGGSERAFDLYLRRKYGITSQWYYSKMIEQDYCCAVCRKSQSIEGRKFAVDHNHKTGVTRGILCQPCNTALGLLKEDESTITELLSYIKKAA